MSTNKSPEDVVKRLQELVSEATAQQLKVIEQYGKVSQRFLRGDLAADWNPAKVTQFWTDEIGRYVQGLTEANLSYYTAIVDLGRGFLEHLSRESSKPASPRAKSAAAPSVKAPRRAARKAARAQKQA